MADITITPNDDDLELDFNFESPQQFSYNIAVVNQKTNQQVFHAKGQWDGKTKFILGKAQDLLGCQLMIYWTIIDPAGAGNSFSANATVNQHANDCRLPQVCTGVSNATQVYRSTIGTFVS